MAQGLPRNAPPAPEVIDITAADLLRWLVENGVVAADQIATMPRAFRAALMKPGPNLNAPAAHPSTTAHH